MRTIADPHLGLYDSTFAVLQGLSIWSPDFAKYDKQQGTYEFHSYMNFWDQNGAGQLSEKKGVCLSISRDRDDTKHLVVAFGESGTCDDFYIGIWEAEGRAYNKLPPFPADIKWHKIPDHAGLKEIPGIAVNHIVKKIAAFFDTLPKSV